MTITQEQMITIEDVISCIDEQQLTDWCAEICMGWTAIYAYHRHIYTDNPENKRQPNAVMDFRDWQPLSNTDKGLAQCLRLIDKYKLFISEQEGVWFVSGNTHVDKDIIESVCFQIAIVKASICVELAKREGE